MNDGKTGVILVGHGASPSDFPRELVRELKELEGRRVATQGVTAPMGAREAELDRQCRNWPRTPKNDPYQAGLNALADKLRLFVGSAPVVAAYNEFCGPSVEDAAEQLIARGCRKIVVSTVMLTRGGVHSENEIPEIVKALEQKHPGVRIVYAWPYDETQVAELLARQLQNF